MATSRIAHLMGARLLAEHEGGTVEAVRSARVPAATMAAVSTGAAKLGADAAKYLAALVATALSRPRAPGPATAPTAIAFPPPPRRMVSELEAANELKPGRFAHLAGSTPWRPAGAAAAESPDARLIAAAQRLAAGTGEAYRHAALRGLVQRTGSAGDLQLFDATCAAGEKQGAPLKRQAALAERRAVPRGLSDGDRRLMAAARAIADGAEAARRHG